MSLASLLTALAVVEIGLRFSKQFDPQAPLFPGDKAESGGNQTDPVLGWRMPPSTTSPGKQSEFDVEYVSNEQGFRDTESFEPASCGIAFVGDSMTFGIGVENDETFAELLEAQFPECRCFNLGIPGFGVDQMWLALRHFGLELRPKIAVAAFILDDLNRSLTAYRWRGEWASKPTFVLRDDELVPLSEENAPSRLTRWILQHSRLFELRRKYERRASLCRPTGTRWQLNRAIFQAMQQDCAQAGCRLVVVFLVARGENLESPVFAAEFQNLGIPFLDLQAELRERPDLYYTEDRHLNPAGHRWVAEQLATFLRAQEALAQ